MTFQTEPDFESELLLDCAMLLLDECRPHPRWINRQKDLFNSCLAFMFGCNGLIIGKRFHVSSTGRFGILTHSGGIFMGVLIEPPYWLKRQTSQTSPVCIAQWLLPTIVYLTHTLTLISLLLCLVYYLSVHINSLRIWRG